MAREDSDAVPGLLAAHGGVVAEFLERRDRDVVGGRLEFLEADDIGPPRLEPVDQEVEARSQAVDVPGGDQQAASSSRRTGRRSAP